MRKYTTVLILERGKITDGKRSNKMTVMKDQNFGLFQFFRLDFQSNELLNTSEFFISHKETLQRFRSYCFRLSCRP